MQAATEVQHLQYLERNVQEAKEGLEEAQKKLAHHTALYERATAEKVKQQQLAAARFEVTRTLHAYEDACKELSLLESTP